MPELRLRVHCAHNRLGEGGRRQRLRNTRNGRRDRSWQRSNWSGFRPGDLAGVGWTPANGGLRQQLRRRLPLLCSRRSVQHRPGSWPVRKGSIPNASRRQLLCGARLPTALFGPLTQAHPRAGKSVRGRHGGFPGSLSRRRLSGRECCIHCSSPFLAEAFHNRTQRGQQRLPAGAKALPPRNGGRQEVSGGHPGPPCALGHSQNLARARRRTPTRDDLDSCSNGHAKGKSRRCAKGFGGKLEPCHNWDRQSRFRKPTRLACGFSLKFHPQRPGLAAWPLQQRQAPRRWAAAARWASAVRLRQLRDTAGTGTSRRAPAGRAGPP